MTRGIRRHFWIETLALLWGLCAPVYAARADDGELDDAAARMQYAFYTKDSRGLEAVLGQLAGIEALSVPGLKEYYAAYGNWKLSQLYADDQASSKTERRGSSDKAAQECAKQAKAAAAADARMAEAYAIESICSSASAFLIGGNCSRSKSLRTALEIEPQNPRVRLIEYLCGDKENPGGGLKQLQEVVTIFDTAPPSRPGKPDWGQAEALVLLGQSYMSRGDAVAARDSLEKALVLAPDYRKAQELLQTVAARPK